MDVQPPLDLSALQTLLALSDRGSVQGAAAVLGISRATVRRRLDDLERRVGTPLLLRDGGGMRLTPSGQLLVDESGDLLSRSDALLESARRAATEVTGVIHAGIPAGIPGHVSSQLLLMLQAGAGSQIRIVFEEAASPDLASARELDLVFHLGPPPQAGEWYSRVVRRLRMRLLASPDYLARRGPIHAPEDLADHHLLVWRPPAGPCDVLARLDGEALPVVPWLATRDIAMLRWLASRGGGVAYAPDGDIPDDPGIGPLIPVLDDVIGAEEVLRASAPLPSRLDPRAAEVIKQLFELFEGMD